MPDTPYAVLRQLLLDIGFVEQVGDRFVRFDHLATSTWLTFPRFEDEDLVDQGNLVGTRGILHGRGILAPNLFEAELEGRIALHHRVG